MLLNWLAYFSCSCNFFHFSSRFLNVVSGAVCCPTPKLSHRSPARPSVNRRFLRKPPKFSCLARFHNATIPQMPSKKIASTHTTCPDEVDVDVISVRNLVHRMLYHHRLRQAREHIGVIVDRSWSVNNARTDTRSGSLPSFVPEALFSTSSAVPLAGGDPYRNRIEFTSVKEAAKLLYGPSACSQFQLGLRPNHVRCDY